MSIENQSGEYYYDDQAGTLRETPEKEKERLQKYQEKILRNIENRKFNGQEKFNEIIKNNDLVVTTFWTENDLDTLDPENPNLHSFKDEWGEEESTHTHSYKDFEEGKLTDEEMSREISLENLTGDPHKELYMNGNIVMYDIGPVGVNYEKLSEKEKEILKRYEEVSLKSYYGSDIMENKPETE